MRQRIATEVCVFVKGVNVEEQRHEIDWVIAPNGLNGYERLVHGSEGIETLFVYVFARLFQVVFAEVGPVNVAGEAQHFLQTK